MRVYLAPKVLIIDEIGYLPLDELGATIFFQLVSTRYRGQQHHPNLEYELRRLGLDFRVMQSSPPILDRLLHHSTMISIRGESYRLKERRRAGLLPRPDEQQPPMPLVTPDSRGRRKSTV